jgi:LmbE family N-acetylglucosaminyl deacetylase
VGWLAVLIAGASALVFGLTSPASSGATYCAAGSSVYVVAHEDDSILFQDPDLAADIASGRCVETIFVTAGDAGQGASFWMGREQGAEAAYAQMAGASDQWATSDAGIFGHPMPRVVLDGFPNVSLVFMRLPDGNVDGSGFASQGYESLQKLWQGTISTIDAVDGSSSYTTSDLTSTLSTLLQSAGADRILTQDFVGSYGDGDHSDHHTVAYLTEAAAQRDLIPHTLTSYIDYPITSLPANLSASQTNSKEATWFAYAPFDSNACQTVSACQGSQYPAWWSREYVNASFNQPGPAVFGLGPTSGAVGSSASINVTGFAASTALTVRVGGVSATIGSGGTTDGSGNATVSFTIPSLPVGAQQVVVSDGTNSATSPAVFTVTAQASVSGLSPISGPVGSSASITARGFAASTGLTVRVGGVSATVGSGGTTDASGNAAVSFTIPSLPAGAQQVVVSDGTSTASSPAVFTVTAQASVSGLTPTSGVVASSASIIASGFAASTPLTVRVGGVSATIASGGTTNASGSATVSFTIPSLPAGAQQVVVSDGTNSASSPIVFTVTSSGAANVAPLATVTASSENSSTGQLAVKAVDGSTDGYPGDYTHEWATNGQGVGAWLNLAWTSPQTLTSITLFDRPNLNDQIIGATITFSDGSSLPVGTLPNDGSPLTLTFPAKTVTSLKLTVTAVSATTRNIGLAEIQVFTSGS